LSIPAARRFYKEVTSDRQDDGISVRLDGKAVKTPAKRTLLLPSEALGEAVAEEWRAQDENIRPETMPLTRLACTAIDRVSPSRTGVVNQVSAYGATDLLCYRAEGPPDLVEIQSDQWQPLLDWAADELSTPLVVGSGVVHISQSEDAIAALRRRVDRFTDFELTAVADLTQIMGSLVLALAVVCGRLSWQQAFECSRLDEHWQNQQWGEDAEAAARTETLSREVEAAARFAELARY